MHFRLSSIVSSFTRRAEPEEVAWPGWLDVEEINKAYPPLSMEETAALPYAKYAALLTSEERQWVHIQSWLQSKGYMLRPRFRPGWVPSWSEQTPRHEVRKREDSIKHIHPGSGIVMDAIRIRDRKHVMLKRFPLPADGRNELAINTALSSDPLKNDPSNPALRMLDVLYAPDQCFMISPIGCLCITMFLETVGEGLDFVEQTLQGLVFLHEHRIAHRDCAITNVVMDPSRVFPRGVHPDEELRDRRGRIHVPRSRTRVGGVKYFFIDFGESIMFSPQDDTHITVDSKASIGAPETLTEELLPYDAFKPDIYTMGTTYRERIIEEYAGFDLLLPLIDSMTQEDPNARPSAAEALKQFQSIKATLSRTSLHARVIERCYLPETHEQQQDRTIRHWTRQFFFAAWNLRW